MFSKIFGRLSQALSALTLVGLLIAPIAAIALTNPATIAPRNFQTQQVGYLRIAITATGTGINANGLTCVAAVTGGGNCSVKVGALPYNAYVIRASQQVVTAFNSTTTDTIGLGTAAGTGNQNLVAAQSVHAAGGGTALTVVAANAGLAVTGNNIAQTGANGGFDIWVTFVYTTTNIATVGTDIIVLEFIAPNDGTCIDVPLGATAPAC
jgi:hypothetical protein